MISYGNFISVLFILSFLSTESLSLTSDFMVNKRNDPEDACEVCRCNSTLRIVTCSFAEEEGPNILPRNFPKWSQRIYATSSQIAEVPTSAFQVLSDLIEIKLSYNIISKPFELPDSIRGVNLQNNKLKDVGEMFRGKQRLTELNLQSNEIESLSPDAFKNCSKLSNLNLRYNRITRIDKEVFRGLHSLTNVDFLWNPLISITPNAFDDLCALTQLTFGGNDDGKAQIRSFPSGLFQKCGKNLFEMTIQNTHWQRIEDHSFHGVSESVSLDLSQNLIQSVGKDAFAGITSLIYLQLGRNNLTELSPEVFRNVSVWTLDLSDNNLQYLPDNLLKGQTNLLALLLQRNPIKTITANVFADLTSLRSLTLFHGKLDQIESGAFRNTALTSLYIFGNNISSISGEVLKTASNSLQIIHMYVNPIEVIENEALQHLRENSTIYTSCASLKVLSRYTRTDLEIHCISDSLAVPIEVPDKLKDAFSHDGFDCDNEHDGIFQCRACPVGTYGNRVHHGCVNCPAGGFYQNIPGSSPVFSANIACKYCTNGTYVPPGGGGKSQSDCKVCPNGTNQEIHAGFRACFCLDGYYRKNRFGACQLCPSEGVNCTGDVQRVLKGYAWNFTILGDDLASKYRAFLENMKIKSENYDSNTRYDNSMPMAIKCPRKESCLNEGNEVETQCAEGYEGFLCAECSGNYYPVFDRCYECPDSLWNYLLELVIMALFIAIFCLLTYVRHRITSKKYGIFDSIIAQVKIFLGFWQVMGGLFSALDEISWPDSELFGNILHIMEMNLLHVLAKPHYCLLNWNFDPYEKFLTGFSILLGTAFISAASYWITILVVLRRNRVTRLSCIPHKEVKLIEKVKDWCQLVTFLVLFTLYPSICSVTFQICPWACVPYDLDVDKTIKATFVRADLRYRCEGDHNPRKQLYDVLFFVGMLYVIFFPMTLIIYMYRSLKKLAIKRRNTMTKDESSTNNAPCNETTELLESNNNFKPDQSSIRCPKWCHFLIENYRPKYWYWEMIELFRKMIQIFFLTVFGSGNDVWFAVTILISCSFIVAQASCVPMKESLNVEHWLQVFSLFSILFNVVVFFLLNCADSLHSDTLKIASIALYVINGLIIFLILVNFLKSLYDIFKKYTKAKEDDVILLNAANFDKNDRD